MSSCMGMCIDVVYGYGCDYVYINIHRFMCTVGILQYGNKKRKFNHISDSECTSVRTSAIVPFCADLGPRDSVP